MTPDELLNGFLDDRLSDAELAELAKALDADAEFRKTFVRAVDQHRALGDLLGKQARPARRWVPIAAAAAVALLAVTAYVLTRPPAPPPPIVREVKPPKPEQKPLEPEPKKPEPIPEPEPKPPTNPPGTFVPPPSPPPAKPPESADPPPPPSPSPPTKLPGTFVPEPPRETRVAVATLESVKGEVHTVSGAGQKAARAAQALFEGEGVETGAKASAVVAFADGTRVELRASTTLNGISPARVGLVSGGLVARVAKREQPLVFATRTTEATVLGTRLALTAGERVKLEVQEGKVRFTHEKRSVDVGAGQTSVAAKGVALAVRRTTRGSMMAAPAIWGEDFEEPEDVEEDWRISRNGVGVTYDGPLDFELAAGEGALTTEKGFTGPFKASVDVEFTHRPRGLLLALRLGAWKGGGIVHCDMDEDFYYLTVGDQVLTAANTRKNPRRERWSVELRDDATVFSIDGRELLKARKAAPVEYHLTLMARAKKDTPAGARARFDNLVVDRK